MLFLASLQGCALNLGGRVLAPGSQGAGWWDARCAAMPIVLPPSAAEPRWKMFYYGREGAEWAGGLPAFLPTGVSGVAESEDGLTWSRVRGPLEGGAILRPSEDAAAFDHVQLGMTDVLVNDDDGSYTALYFGGSAEQVSLGMGPGPISGFKMRPAAATSADGLSWERCGANPLLDVGGEGEWDSNFASWPRALPVDQAKPGGKWLMTYHALQPIGAAESDGDKAGDAAPPTSPSAEVDHRSRRATAGDWWQTFGCRAASLISRTPPTSSTRRRDGVCQTSKPAHRPAHPNLTAPGNV